MARGNWEECIPGQPRGRWTRPQATLKPTGDIVFTRHTWDMMERPDYAIVYFDRRADTIGIKPIRGKIRNAFPVQPFGAFGGHIIRADSLLRQFRIKLDKTVRFQLAEIDEDGILNLDLSTATPANHGRCKGIHAKYAKRRDPTANAA